MNQLAGGKGGFEATPINPLDSTDPEKKTVKGRKNYPQQWHKLEEWKLKKKNKHKNRFAIPKVSKRLNFVPLVTIQSMAISVRALEYLLVPNLEQQDRIR